MFISYSVKNYKSIKEKQTINFIPDTSLKDSSINIINNTLNYVILMGDNGVGKSNLIEPIKELLTEIVTRKNPRDRFSWVEPHTEQISQPTEISISFKIDDIEYDYFLSIIERKVYEETLYIKYTSKPTQLFKRVYNEKLNNHDLSISKYLNKKDMEIINRWQSNNTLFLSLPEIFYDMVDLRKIYEYFEELHNRDFLIDNFCFGLSPNRIYHKLNNLQHQTILIAYNPVVLNVSDLRRDQVYIIKKENNSTKAIPLFKARIDGGIVRKDTNLMRSFVEGDYL